jgi:hypothetical protein
MKFRKKPVVIDAIQLRWDTWNDVCDFVGIPANGKGCYVVDGQESNSVSGEIGCVIYTLEGNHLARQNDWIIKGVHGEYYPCKPDIFEKTYEPAE